jgi:uncharacterized ion transporter superfamily protein YfcC
LKKKRRIRNKSKSKSKGKNEKNEKGKKKGKKGKKKRKRGRRRKLVIIIVSYTAAQWLVYYNILLASWVEYPEAMPSVPRNFILSWFSRGSHPPVKSVLRFANFP